MTQNDPEKRGTRRSSINRNIKIYICDKCGEVLTF